MIERIERTAAGLQKYVFVYLFLLLLSLLTYGALRFIADVFGPDDDGEPRVEFLTGDAAEKRIEEERGKAAAGAMKSKGHD